MNNSRKQKLRRASWMAVTLLILTTACTPATPSTSPSATESESISGAAQPGVGQDSPQGISGLGVNANVHNWKGGQLKPAIHKIADLGDVTWRVIIDKADWEPARYGTPLSYDWDYYDSIYSAGKMSDLFNTIEYINSFPGQQVMINVMGPVSSWMGGNHIQPTDEDYWVRMIASMVYYGRVVRHLDFKLLGPMNEEDLNGVEGPLVGPEQYVRLLSKLSKQLDRLGLKDIRFVAPDTAGHDRALSEYLPALESVPALWDRIAVFGIHSYDGQSSDAADVVAQVADRRPATWVTEFSGPCPGCDEGAPNPADWSSALATAGFAVSLIQQGVSGLQFYDAWDGYYEHHASMGYWGALAYLPATGTYSPRKSYYVLAQLIKFTPRNSFLISSSSNEVGMKWIALRSPDGVRLTIFGVNPSDATQRAAITLPDERISSILALYITNSEKDMSQSKAVSMTSGSTEVSIPPNTVFTFTGTIARQ